MGSRCKKCPLPWPPVFQDAVEAGVPPAAGHQRLFRTDTGVHANRFCVSLKPRVPSLRPAGQGAEHQPPWDVAVPRLPGGPLDFTPATAARAKRYVYKILNSEIKGPFWEGLVHQHRYPGCTGAEPGCQVFVGTRLQLPFCSAGGKIEI